MSGWSGSRNLGMGESGGSFVKCFALWVLGMCMMECCYGESFSLEIMHRFSDKARDQLEARHGERFRPWPAKGSVEYHRMLRKRDYFRHGGRILASKNKQLVTFFEGNFTQQLFGGLHYSYVDIGSPSAAYLVALDTGSDLLWLPCQCISCAPTDASNYAPYINKSLSVYNPTASRSYKPVSCSNSLCDKAKNCSKSTNECPYEIDYLSANTSTSGTLVEDVLNLIPEAGGATISPLVVFGCGKNQTGSFLDGAAPDGLLGLGMGDISLPSTLTRAGVAPNSFSMCFDSDGSGRIVFGDKGPVKQPSTPLSGDPNAYSTAYLVFVEQIMVGTTGISFGQSVLFDTGTSYTYLNSNIYTTTVAIYNSQISLPSLKVDGFNLCYEASDPSKVLVPIITLGFANGTTFQISDPLVGIYNSKTGGLVGFCLAVLDSQSDINIIGQNFMTGYSITFDRETMKLGWYATSCYGSNQTESLQAPVPAPAVVAPAPGPQKAGSSSSSSPSPLESPPPAPVQSSPEVPTPTSPEASPPSSAATILSPPSTISVLIAALFFLTFQRQW